jgi:hypothetical protein
MPEIHKKRRVPRHTIIQPPPEANYRFIPLTKGQNAIVDAADFGWLNQYNWHAVSALYKNRRSGWYACSQIDGQYTAMQRLILGLTFEDPRIAEHRNNNSLDNRRGNLRIVTQAQNLMNKAKHRDNQSGYKGVILQGRRWRAQITVKGRRIIIGYYSCREDAAHAYDRASKIHHGEFGRTNFSSQSTNISTPEIETPVERQRNLFDA